MRIIALTAMATVCLAATGSAVAGDLVTGGRVVRIANTGNNLNVFSVEVAGGSQNLCSNVWITFPATAAPDADTYKRAYAAALVALTTGVLVRVYNYQNNSCDAASYIELAAA
jgi:hypothetical protein